MKLTFIRHTSVAVAPGTCYGWTDVDVAPSFEEEASRVRESLQGDTFSRVYCSPLLRCRKLAAFCGFPDPQTDDRLKELNFGRWEMQPWEGITDLGLSLWFEDWIHLPAGGAESYMDQYHRVASFLEELRRQDCRDACIFTHRGVIACAQVYAGQCAIEDSFREEVPYGSKNILLL